jgi:hypothetical protein
MRLVLWTITIERVSGKPTPERIVQDIMALPMVLQKIIDAKGSREHNYLGC